MRWVCWLMAAALCLAGCDRGTPTSAGGGAFRVAMILPGSDTDKGWNQMAREGLDRIKGELGAETKLVTNVKSSEFGSQIDYFAGEGYDVIICHGGEFAQAVEQAAKKHPAIKFIVGGCPTNIAGAVPVEFLARDASYLVGVVAANVTKTKSVAFIGAMAVPTLEACYTGMRDGATSVSADLNVLPPLWTNSWDSPPLAKEKTESAINNGSADVVFQNVDAAARGVFEAVREATQRGKPVYAFGCNSNQNDIAPDVILGSVVLDVQRAYTELAKGAKAGTLKPGARKLGLDGGWVDLVLNEKHPVVTTPMKEAVATARTKLVRDAKK
jgi:basic membrane protein A and related proteins